MKLKNNILTFFLILILISLSLMYVISGKIEKKESENDQTKETITNIVENKNKELNLTVKDILDMRQISQELVSLERPIGEDEDDTVGQFISDDKPTPEEEAINNKFQEEVIKLLDCLTERERKVIELRFGIGVPEPMTLEEVGHIFGVTRERIRQIEAKSLRKLRSPLKSKNLRGYID